MVKQVALNCKKESPTSFQQLELAFSLSISILKIKKETNKLTFCLWLVNIIMKFQTKIWTQ